VTKEIIVVLEFPTPIITTGYTGDCGTQVQVITSTYDETIDSLSKFFSHLD